MSMVEPELTLFQVQVDVVELRKSSFGKTPEGFDSARVMLSSVKPDIHQSIVTTPTVGVYDAVDVSLAPDDGLQCGFGGVGDDFAANAIVAFEQAENDGLAICAMRCTRACYAQV